MAFGVSAAAFTTVAFLASALPALRAARVDPMMALRRERAKSL
jgi:ABC-type antimicrobial peptide transport system permease subunit